MIHTVSNSEIDCFRQCPKKHEFTYKQFWVPPAVGPALVKGTLWHKVLETHFDYLKLCQDGEMAVDAKYLHKLVSAHIYDERGDYQSEHAELIEWMYKGYLEKWPIREELAEYKILAVEHAFEFWLPTPRGTRSNYKVRMKLDLVVETRKDRRIWLVDHKSGKDLPTDKMLELDPQFSLYTWGLRKAGKKIFGQIHDVARTLKYKDESKPQPLDERFRRTMMYRTDEQLDQIAHDAYRSARRAYQTKLGDAERCFNSDTCRWRCDFTEPCLLLAKKGTNDWAVEEAVLKDFGFVKGDPYERYRG